MENKTIKAGTKIVIGVDAGMAGTDHMEAYILTQDYTVDELSDIAWEEGVQWAESYGIYPTSHGFLEEDEDADCYSDNIEGWWELYNEDEHAGKCRYGEQREVHFQEL